ncbi:pectate lyase PelN [Uliginosibacterium gangwonense]|uniref:pectate lyase PelN n=1 Tax=Uliginosibacterium gangwonense TaxID=392736 RepID=UPI0003AA615F|nr:pectate lyase PelN [Uliginosibacterium gangwonense]
MTNRLLNLFLHVLLACSVTPCFASTYYIAPNGDDSSAGTLAAPWKTITRAQSSLQEGDLLLIRGGTYTITSGLNTCASKTDIVNAITLYKSGSPSNPIKYWAYDGETPVFDFSKMTDNCRVKGFNVVADWIYLKGIEVTGVPQQPGNTLNHESWGIWVKGSYNVFERLNLHHNMGPGFYLNNGGYNLVLNSDSHHNYDPYTSNGAGQSGDGFGAHVGSNHPGNVFRGCRAWSNSDDGFDLINANSSVTIENSWAWLSGYLPGTTTALPYGNGNGFKAGGYSGVYVADGAKHTIRFSVAFLNKASGFYANHHTIANDYFNNIGFQNHPNFNMLGINSAGQAVNLGVLRNNVSYGGVLLSNITGTDAAYNSWNLNLTVTNADFEGVSTTGWDAPRQADGSLPVIASLHLAAGSQLINKGINVGLSYLGSAPDLGAFERQ